MKDKTVFITGASSGFGEACAKVFGDAGYALVLAARNVDKLKQVAAGLEGKTSVHIAKLDVRDRSAVAEFVSALPPEYRKIDVLVNNAGLALGLEPIDQTSLDDWDTMIDTNIKGLLSVTRRVLPGMVERDSGHIINIGSIAGSWPYPGGNVYSASKSFVQQFSRSLRADLLGRKIRVTNIDPGLAETNFSVVRLKGDVQKAKEIYRGTQPLTAKDIADIVYWVTTVPPHVNINTLEVMPVCQAWGHLAVDRNIVFDN